MEEKKFIGQITELSLENMTNVNGGRSAPPAKFPCPFCGQEFDAYEMERHHLICFKPVNGSK